MALVAVAAGAAPAADRLDQAGPVLANPPAANLYWRQEQSVSLPGRGMALAWAPDGRALAVGGHFKERSTGLRYDTRVYDLASNALTRSFACHLFWVIATAWSNDPYVGEVIADGGGDHAVKVWNARARGSATCKPGQARAADGAVKTLPEIDGWVTSLAFSRDGRFLAAVSRDRTLRLWSLLPGAHQWQVVALWNDRSAKQFLSVDWAPDGRALVTADRRGQIAVWDFDPVRDLWDDATVADFAKVGFKGQAYWFKQHADLVTRVPRWRDVRRASVWRARFYPDGSAVAASGADGLVSVLDASDGAPRFRVGAPTHVAFDGLDVHPGGGPIAAGGADGNVYLFDALTGVLRDVLSGHADVVTAAAWSPDGSRLATTAGGQLLSLENAYAVTGPDQTVRIWVHR